MVVKSVVAKDRVEWPVAPDAVFPSVSNGLPPPLSVMSVCELLVADDVPVAVCEVSVSIALLELGAVLEAAVTVSVKIAEDVVEVVATTVVVEVTEEALVLVLEADVVAAWLALVLLRYCAASSHKLDGP